MKLIEADHERRYEIPGVPGPARKPVDIDAAKTGFTQLRSLRVYRFDEGATVDGHAEEDEVLVVVTSGSVEMKIGWENSSIDAAGVYTLAAPENASTLPFVAYLPPGSAYQLTPHTTADVAYARATPNEPRSPAVFGANLALTGKGASLLSDVTHAEKLRLRVFRFQAGGVEASVSFGEDDDKAGAESLVHVQGSPAEHVADISTFGGESLFLQSWQTVALQPEERAVLRVPSGAEALVLVVSAV